MNAPAKRLAPSLGDKRAIWSWAVYDFANSPFSTTITTVVFNVYFVKVVVGDGGYRLFGHAIPGDAWWSYLIAASTLSIAVLSPLLGAMADHSGSKKLFLAGFTVLGAAATAALYFADAGAAGLASLNFFCANLAFAGAFAFYNSLLLDVAPQDQIGRISGLGWACGYIGGGLCLALNLAMIQQPAWFGLPADGSLKVRLSFVVVGAWWLLFSVPLLLWVRERAGAAAAATQGWGEIAREGFTRVGHTFRQIRRFPQLVRFLFSYLLYNDGIETIIVIASVFAATEIGMQQGEIIQCFLLIQFVAFIGSLVFGKLADRFGAKKAILGSLLLWILIVLWAMVMTTSREFWVAGALIGLVLGGSQAASRALYAEFTPEENSAEFFGFLSLSGKMMATLGPLTYGWARQVFGDVRPAIGSILIFFIAGAALLTTVDEAAGKAQAKEAVA